MGLSPLSVPVQPGWPALCPSTTIARNLAVCIAYKFFARFLPSLHSSHAFYQPHPSHAFCPIMSTVVPINESIREIDGNSWLITNNLLLSRQPKPSSTQPSWDDGGGQFFVLSEAPSPVGETFPAARDERASESLRCRRCLCRLESRRRVYKGEENHRTRCHREHVTLDFLHGKDPLEF